MLSADRSLIITLNRRRNDVSALNQRNNQREICENL